MNATLPNLNGAACSPAELVRAMSAEVKEGVLLALIREAVQIHGDTGLLPIDDETGKPLGYYVPPKAAVEHFRSLAPILSSAQREITLRSLANLDNTFDIGSFLAELKEEDEKQG